MEAKVTGQKERYVKSRAKVLLVPMALVVFLAFASSAPAATSYVPDSSIGSGPGIINPC